MCFRIRRDAGGTGETEAGMDITERKITKIAREAEKLKASKAEIEASFYAYLTDTLTREEAAAFAVVLDKLYTVSYICAAWMKKPVQQAGAAYKKAAGALSAATLDRAQNAVTYRICDSHAAMERTNFYDAVYSPAVLLLNAAVVGAAMLLSASGRAEILALFGMSVGTSVTVINYISRIFAPIESLGMEIQTIQSAMAGVKRIDAFLSQPERAVPPEVGKPARGDVVLSHVTFGYGERPVLHDFSMTVRQGEQVTLVGRTGAGKSTVFKLLLGLYQPQAGSITIGGVDAATIRALPEGYATVCTDGMFSRSSSKAAPSPNSSSSTAAVRSGITSMAILDCASRFLMVMPIPPHNKRFAAIIPQTAPQC